MRQPAEPCRTLLVNIHMYARTRMRARGFRSQGNRFGRYGRYGRRPVLGMRLTGTALLATTSPTFAPCRVSFPTLATRPKVALGPTRANVAYPPASPQAVGTWKNFVAGLAHGNGSRPSYSLF
jgi:hypothetical protein